MADPKDLPELLLPAGGFDSAIAGIEGGADALYLGFSEFSARKQARNFDRLEYRRLLRFAREKGVRLYVALNTLLMEEEVERAAILLSFLGRFPPDAVLVQDWGLARLMRERYPSIPIHASTQTAVQGVQAARIAREMGAVRVVLPRETSLAEMKRLREEEPGIEYEAFVHGALCYSFSGLCLASGIVLGRSGNRGECAQLCRSCYEAAESGGEAAGDASGGRGYWFSCRDMELGDRVADLAAAGIASLKVEGRMKGPEYCYAVAKYYRGLLDRLAGEGPGEREIAHRLDAARTAFSRSPTEAWLLERGGASLIDFEYPGHRGVRAGRIRSVSGGWLLVDLERGIGIRDGLLGFEGGDPSRPLRFSAASLRDPRTGRELIKASAGSRIELPLPATEDGRPASLKAGQDLFRISARDQDRREASREEYEPERESLDLELRIGAEGIGAELSLPGFGGFRETERRQGKARAPIEPGEPVPLARARAAGGFSRALALFSESGEADFRLVPLLDPSATVELPIAEGEAAGKCALADVFVPPSAMKREKNRIYARAAEILSEAELAYARGYGPLRGRLVSDALEAPWFKGAIDAPPRSAIVFPREDLPSGMPFATPRTLSADSPLPSWGGRLWIPLAPLVRDREEYGKLVRSRLRKELEAGSSVAVGLGAPHPHPPAAGGIRGTRVAEAEVGGRAAVWRSASGPCTTSPWRGSYRGKRGRRRPRRAGARMPRREAP